MAKNKEKYTHPDLREEIKESDRGGRPGQWSARKSQLLTREYEERHKNRKTSSSRWAAKRRTSCRKSGPRAPSLDRP